LRLAASERQREPVVRNPTGRNLDDDVSRWGNPYEKGRGHWRDNSTEIVRSCWDGGASTTPSMQVGEGHLAEPETA
jgi:hypothetical protein